MVLRNPRNLGVPRNKLDTFVSIRKLMPNPSIERTLPGKPASASHVKR